jgi:hypothetical protein
MNATERMHQPQSVSFTEAVRYWLKLPLLLIEHAILFRHCSIFRPVQAGGCIRREVMPTNTNLLHILGGSLLCHNVCVR